MVGSRVSIIPASLLSFLYLKSGPLWRAASTSSLVLPDVRPGKAVPFTCSVDIESVDTSLFPSLIGGHKKVLTYGIRITALPPVPLDVLRLLSVNDIPVTLLGGGIEGSHVRRGFIEKVHSPGKDMGVAIKQSGEVHYVLHGISDSDGKEGEPPLKNEVGLHIAGHKSYSVFTFTSYVYPFITICVTHCNAPRPGWGGIPIAPV